MKNFILILGVTTLCAGEPVKKLNVFSYTAVAQLMYEEIHKTQSHEDDKYPITDPELKEEMCHYITANDRLFDPSIYERIYMYEIYDELKTEYEDIFNELYEEPSDSSVVTSGRDKIYMNANKEIRMYNPWDNRLYPENVFVCLIRRTSTEGEKKLEKIYVSGEYDARHRPNAVGPHRASRFIFNHNENSKDPMVHGFVEEPAKVLSASIAYLENLYLQRRDQFNFVSPGEDECPQYLRELNIYEITRFCNVALNAIHYEGKHRYSECYTGDRDATCVKRKVAFETDGAKLKIIGKHYVEWTLRCQVQENRGTFAWYHISRAADKFDAEIFVYREIDEREMVLENLSTNVRFLVPFGGDYQLNASQ